MWRLLTDVLSPTRHCYSYNENCKRINELTVAEKRNVEPPPALRSCLIILIRGPRNHTNPQRRDYISVEITVGFKRKKKRQGWQGLFFNSVFCGFFNLLPISYA
jgi:hypothetical protein